MFMASHLMGFNAGNAAVQRTIEAADWAGATGDYSLGSGTASASASNRAIYTSGVLLSGDFRVKCTLDAAASIGDGAVFGVFLDGAEASVPFNGNSSTGLTTGGVWQVFYNSDQAKYNNANEGSINVTVGDTIQIRRVGTTLSCSVDNFSTSATWTTTSAADLRILLGQGNSALSVSGLTYRSDGNDFT